MDYPRDAALGRARSLAASLSYGFTHAFTQAERARLAVLHLFRETVNADAFRLMGEVPEGARAFTWRHDGAIGSYLATFQNEGDPEPAGQWLEGGKTSRPFSLREMAARLSRLDVFRLYAVLGFTHILPKGPDHILFVLGLFLLSLRIRPILSQVTAFTVAHSITLGLSIYGVVSLPPRIVEPLIALSIVYVAIENLVTDVFRPWRVGVVFGFGLVHGLGFAGVLRELVGYGVYRGLIGHIDKQTPAALLDGESPNTMVWDHDRKPPA